MKWHIKLDGVNITEHVSDKYPFFNPADYDAVVKAGALVDLATGDYKYKYEGGELVELNQTEIDEQPANVEKNNEGFFHTLRELVVDRLVLTEVIDHPAIPAKWKTRATAKRTKVNQDIADLLGL